jgi:hypothetical protein
VPQCQDIRRLALPCAACCRPGAWGTTDRQRRPVGTRHPPIVGQVEQPLAPVRLHGLVAQVACVSRGSRSGRSTRPWLRVAALLSLGFPPSRVPLMSAGQWDLTPLCMCSPWYGLSVCPVKGRGRLEAGARHERTLEGVGSRPLLGSHSYLFVRFVAVSDRLLLDGGQERGRSPLPVRRFGACYHLPRRAPDRMVNRHPAW